MNRSYFNLVYILNKVREGDGTWIQDNEYQEDKQRNERGNKWFELNEHEIWKINYNYDWEHINY